MTADRAAGPVLVTGGLGFIGGYVTRELVDLGRKVTALSRGPSTPDMRFLLKDQMERIDIETGSVEDLATLVATFERVRPETVVHSAANVEVAKLFHVPGRHLDRERASAARLGAAVCIAPGWDRAVHRDVPLLPGPGELWTWLGLPAVPAVRPGGAEG